MVLPCWSQKSAGSSQHAGVEQVGVLERLVVEVVLGGRPSARALMRMLMSFDTSTTSRPRLLLAQAPDDAEDLVVGLAVRQAGGQRGVDQRRSGRTGGRRPRAARCSLSGMPSRCRRRRASARSRPARRGSAADLARVARDLGHALLVVVELLERDHRQVDVVLLEAEQARRVVHQHVGVEHEQRGRARGRAACAGRAGGAAVAGAGAAPASRRSSPATAATPAAAGAGRQLAVAAGARLAAAARRGRRAWPAAVRPGRRSRRLRAGGALGRGGGRGIGRSAMMASAEQESRLAGRAACGEMRVDDGHGEHDAASATARAGAGRRRRKPLRRPS